MSGEDDGQTTRRLRYNSHRRSRYDDFDPNFPHLRGHSPRFVTFDPSCKRKKQLQKQRRRRGIALLFEFLQQA
jgi:hypothetical protein